MKERHCVFRGVNKAVIRIKTTSASDIGLINKIIKINKIE